jgi:DNA-binding transcriptional LysR family regulator
MPRLSTFHQLYPEIEIQVAISTRQLTEFNNHFDVVLQSTGRRSGLRTLVLTVVDEVFPVCIPHYLTARQSLQITDLRLHTLLHHRATSPDLFEWDTWLHAFGQTFKGFTQGLVFDSYPLMLQTAVEGHGIAMGWRRTAGRLIDSGALVRPCAESVPLPEAISIFKRFGVEDTAEVRALIEWLAEELSGESSIPIDCAGIVPLLA